MCYFMSFKLFFIDPQIKTPTLLLLGADDVRVPPKQGTNFHRLLKAKGVETRYVRIECIGTKRFLRLWLTTLTSQPLCFEDMNFETIDKCLFVCLFRRLLWYPGNNHPISKVDAESDVFVNLARWFFEHIQK